jgi:hypothetical protein
LQNRSTPLALDERIVTAKDGSFSVEAKNGELGLSRGGAPHNRSLPRDDSRQSTRSVGLLEALGEGFTTI